MSAPLQLAIFDVDGTLVDSQHNIVASMTDAFLENGLAEPPPAAVRSIIGLSLIEAVEGILPEAEPELINRVAQAYKDAFFRRRVGPDFTEALFPGVVEIFDALEARGVLLALATGKSRRGVESFVERHGFERRFVATRCADDGPGKPDPWMVLDAVASIGGNPGSTAMIGDTTYDMEMAARSGALGVGVAWGYHDAPALMAAGARLVVDRFDQVTDYLAGQWQGETEA
ncbi:MAG: HAD family hydrolase [Rhodospirillum sp.]|nr:HAD family hydrolase [Rhodospirillum sp.]MCF8488069.1 HAD family hydrolase [Rhodospirillum sp.]MCF8502200.1 HAD family hydrolase [Rhodospirillum sp.]